MVHKGKDGWLFLTGGSNQVLQFYLKPNVFSDALLTDWLERLRQRTDRCGAFGSKYFHLVAPEKLTVYSEYYDGDLPYLHDAPSFRLGRAATPDGPVVHVLDYFLRQKRHYQLYWKTDTHWTFHGCYCAYQILCSRLGIPSNTSILQGVSRSNQIVLDLGAKVDPPVKEEFTLVQFGQQARRVAANAMVSYKEEHHLENDIGFHVGSNVVFTNDSPDAIDKRVVLFGDSFSEYRPHLLTGMLAATFRELHFVWSINLDWSYIDRVRPDLVLTEASERFMGQVPSDTFTLEAYVEGRLAEATQRLR